MENEEANYYLIWQRVVGKRIGINCFIFENGEWKVDTEHLIMDKLAGYNPYEPPGSPYGIGNTSIMDEIEDITYEEAMRLTGGIE